MANELRAPIMTTGLTITAKLYFNGSLFGSPISCAEVSGTGLYYGTMPAVGAGLYAVIYTDSSGNIQGYSEIDWSGSVESSLTNISSRIPAALVGGKMDSNATVTTSGLTTAEHNALMAIPANPLLTTDTRLNNLDATISSRLATSGYTAPDNSTIASTLTAVNGIPTNPLLTTDPRLDNLDAAVSSRMATFTYTAPDNATIASTLTAVNLRPTNPLLTADIRLDYLDAAISSRMATFAYTAPPTSAAISSAVWSETTRALTDKVGFGLSTTERTAIKDAVDASTILAKEATLTTKASQASVTAIPTNPLLTTDVRLNNLANADVATSSRMATFTYTAPDNATIASIDNRIPAALVGGKMDSNVATINTNAITATAIATSALNGKGDWLLSASYTAAPTLSQIEASTILAKEATLSVKASQTSVNAIPTSTLLAADPRLDNLDATISSRLAASNYVSPPSIAGLATTAQLNSAVDDIKGAGNYDNTDLYIHTPSVDLTGIATTTQVNAARDSIKGANNQDLSQIKTGIDAIPTATLTTTEHNALVGLPTLTQIESSAILAKESTLSDKASQSSVNLIPTNPLLTTDTRLNNLANADVATSTRMATFTYTAPDNTGIANTLTAVNLRPTNPLLANDTRLNNLDATISSRLATSAYTAPPSITGLATATELNNAVINIKGAGDKDLTQVSTSVAEIPTAPLLAADYEAPDNGSINTIKIYASAINSATQQLWFDVDGNVSARIKAVDAGAIPATDISSLATTSQLNSAVSNIKGASDKDLTQVFNNSQTIDLSSVAKTTELNAAVANLKGSDNKDLTQVYNHAPVFDLTPITSKLPSNGAKIAGEGATAKNLDQIVATSAPDPTLSAKIDQVLGQTDKMTFTIDNKIEAKVSYSVSDLQPPCDGDCF